MPRREVHFTLWQLGIIFLILAASYAFGLVLASHASGDAKRAAIEARHAAAKANQAIVATRRVRIDQLRDICEYANEQNRRIVDYVVLTSRQGERRRAGVEAAFPQIVNCEEFARQGAPIQQKGGG